MNAIITIVSCLLLQIGCIAKQDVGLFMAKEDQFPFSAVRNSSEQWQSKFECNSATAYKADSGSSKEDHCPLECPYWAQDRTDTEVCTFRCVKAHNCAKWNPNKPMADTIKGSRTCRGPRVQFCTTMAVDGTDSCAVCQPMFGLHVVDGQCYFQYWYTLYTFVTILLIAVLGIAFWVIDWCLRPTVNGEELAIQEKYANRTRLLMPKTEGGRRQPYPLETNLTKESIAGLGMLLHFRFQVAIIIWPLFIALFWWGFCMFHEELYVIGTKKFGTPRHNCILVAWGYETQHGLMWTKVAFLAITYVYSFIFFLAFSVMQYSTYQVYNHSEKTMMKFALEVTGLPNLPGTQDVEGDLKKAVEAKTGKGTVVGVSIAWRYSDEKDVIDQAITNDLVAHQYAITPREQPTLPDPTANMPEYRKKLYGLETYLFGPDDEVEVGDIKATLEKLVTSDTAFVVFNTTEDAVKAKDDVGTIEFEGKTLTLNKNMVEPNTVFWENFYDTSSRRMMISGLRGFFKYYVPALSIWFFVFYLPYAASLYYFNYDNGAELPGVYGLVFTMVVVAGNAVMYQVCQMCADEIGFKYSDSNACAYMLMYLAACMINVFLDMAVTYMTALKVMRGLDFRNYFGTRLDDIHSFTEQFETYAMQRSLGENTKAYAWPSTFLVPFLIEPFVTIVVPYQLGRLIIRTHTDIKGTAAETWIKPFDFDTGRYADILLNVFLGILIFYFPGGYNITLFIGMFISHIWIYCFDHWKVLRGIPTIRINTFAIDWWSQVMLIGCCAVIMSSLVFKANCADLRVLGIGNDGDGFYCLKDYKLIAATIMGGVLSFTIHMILLFKLVPVLAGKGTHQMSNDMVGRKFSQCAAEEPYSWFTTNKVHCLRSQFIKGDKPYCRYCDAGKEHLLEVNEKIGLHFSDEAADVTGDEAGLWGHISKKFSKKDVTENETK
jgi:hypothetical protein